MPGIDLPSAEPHVAIMSTLSEIKAALPGLSPADLVELNGAVDFLLRRHPRRFTGRDAANWARTRQRLDEKEAEAFAADIEAGRRETNTSPAALRWE